MFPRSIYTYYSLDLHLHLLLQNVCPTWKTFLQNMSACRPAFVTLPLTHPSTPPTRPTNRMHLILLSCIVLYAAYIYISMVWSLFLDNVKKIFFSLQFILSSILYVQQYTGTFDVACASNSCYLPVLNNNNNKSTSSIFAFDSLVILFCM